MVCFMNEYKILLNVNLKQLYALPKEQKERKKAIGKYVGMGCALLPLLAIVCVLLYFMVSMMTSMPDSNKILASMIGGCMTGVQFFVLINGFISYMSVMFYSKDTEILMSMPIKPMSVYMSKFTVVYLTHIFVSILMFFPILLVVGIAAKITSVAYYIIGLFAMLITPVIPLFIISLLALPMAYVVKFARKHRTLGIIAVLVAFVALFTAYFLLVMKLSVGEGGANDLVTGALGVFQALGTAMYPNIILAKAMLGTDITILTNFLIYFAIVAVLAAVSLVLSVLLYKKAVPKFMEVGTVKIKSKDVVKANSCAAALIKTELKNFSRDMTSAINYVIGLFLTPIIVCVMLFASLSQLPDISQIMNTMNMVIIFGVGSNYLAILPISREGKTFHFLKTLPINPKDYLRSKEILANAYTFIIIFMVAIIYFIKGINPLYVLIYLIDTMILSIGINALVMSRDIAKPNFYWTNNKELFKQNNKVLLPMLICISLMLVLIGLSIAYSFIAASLTELIADIIFWGIYTAIAVAFFVTMRPNFYKKNIARLACIE